MKEVIDGVLAKLDLVTELGYICENWGQLDFFEETFPFEWPAALVEIRLGTASHMGWDKEAAVMERQQFDFDLAIHVCDRRLDSDSAETPASRLNAASTIWDLLEDIHANLQGYIPTEKSTKLIRKTLEQVERTDGIQEYIVIYSACLNNV